MINVFARTVWSGLVCLVLMAACGPEEKEKPSIETTALDREAENLIRRAADKTIGDFTGDLGLAMKVSIREGGAATAIDMCGQFAASMASAHSPDGWYIQRVSDRNRNVNNFADSLQHEILTRFGSDRSLEFIGRWDSTGPHRLFCYYRPVYVTDMCLDCHGLESRLASGIVEALEQSYPDDRAIGYNVGDLRGMFVVEVEWPRGQKHARDLIDDIAADEH